MKAHRSLLIVIALSLVLLQLAATLFGASLVGSIELKRDLFKRSSDLDFLVCKFDAELPGWLQRELQSRLFVDANEIPEAHSAAELRTAPGPAYRLKADSRLYVNGTLWHDIQDGNKKITLSFNAEPLSKKVIKMTPALLVLLGVFVALNWPEGTWGSPTGNSMHRMPALDSLRGIAALVVMVCHALWMLFPEHGLRT